MNHGDAAPAVADGIIHVSFLSRGASIKKKKKSKLPLRPRLGAVLGRVLLPLRFGTSPPVSVAPLLGVRELIRGGFRLVDAPPSPITVPLSETFFPPWSPSRG